MNALILVDPQNDFCPDGAPAVPGGDNVIPLVNELQKQFDLVVAIQDWHPPEHARFAANHPVKQPGEVVEIAGLPQILWPVHCVQETPGAELHPALDRTAIERVFRKGKDALLDGYSGFFDRRCPASRREDVGKRDSQSINNRS
jgi:nicotinamidase/pyrazinamidase